MSNKIYVHASSLPTWHDCQRRWASNNLSAKAPGEEGNALPVRSIGAIIGNHAHAAATDMLSRKRDGDDINIVAIVDKTVEDFRKYCKTVKIDLDNGSRSQGDAEMQMVRQIMAWHRGYLPLANPVFVEAQLQANYGLTNIVLVGQPDVVNQVSEYEWGIDDHKFGSHPGAYDAQMGLYMLLVSAQDWFVKGSKIPQVRIDHTKRVGVKSVQPETETIPRNPAACEEIARKQLDEIEPAVNYYHATGDLWAFNTNPASKYCNKTSCKWFQTDYCNQGGQEIGE